MHMAAPKRPTVTFIDQKEPVEEYGRALYAVARSIIRAHLDSLSEVDLADLNTEIGKVTLRQLAKIVRLERDKGGRGDGFEWAVHEAILGKEARVTEPISHALFKASQYIKKDIEPTSLLFGQERARYLGFTEAIVTDAGADALLIPGLRGRPFKFGPHVATAARGQQAELFLPDRVKKIWKTDLFIAGVDSNRHFATTVKSNIAALEGGRGLRLAIVPESPGGNPAGVRFDADKQLWIVSLADPNGFMGLFDDAYRAVARAIATMGKHDKGPYYATKPSAKGVRLQEQLEKFESAAVVEVEGALNEAAQQNLISTEQRLVSVNPPDWLHIKQLAPKIIAPKPSFAKLD
jgi:hypothetical protein